MSDLVHVPRSAIERPPEKMGGEMITAALIESRNWLTKAIKAADPTPIANFRAWAATVEEAARHKKLGREIELDAAEMVRRSDRGVGVAIREGQKAGEISTRGDHRSNRVLAKGLVSPKVFFDSSDQRTDTYLVTDGVSDEQFEAAITEAKAEGDLSRANVVRKVTGKRTPRATKRPKMLRKTRRLDPNRVIEETINAADPDAGGVLELVDYTELDGDRLEMWISSLSSHMDSLRSLRAKLQKELNRRVTD